MPDKKLVISSKKFRGDSSVVSVRLPNDMIEKLDLTGQKFGKLTVLSEHPERKNKKIYWLCKCDCGVEKLIAGADLKSGRTISCGCNKIEKTNIPSVGVRIIQRF